MVMDVRFVFMLPAGVRMRAVRMIHSRMVVLVPVRGDEVLHLSSRTALAVVREMDVIVIVHQRLVLVALQIRGHLYDASSLRLSSHHPRLNSLACSAREALASSRAPRGGEGGLLVLPSDSASEPLRHPPLGFWEDVPSVLRG
jgi:hypothetical protein